MSEVMIENRTNVLQRLPVADADVSELGDFVELGAAGDAGARVLLEKGQWARMRLQYPFVQKLYTKQRIVVR